MSSEFSTGSRSPPAEPMVPVEEAKVDQSTAPSTVSSPPAACLEHSSINKEEAEEDSGGASSPLFASQRELPSGKRTSGTVSFAEDTNTPVEAVAGGRRRRDKGDDANILSKKMSQTNLQEVMVRVQRRQTVVDEDGTMKPSGLNFTTSRHKAVGTELEDSRPVLELQETVRDQEADLKDTRQQVYIFERQEKEWKIRENILRGQLRSRKAAINILRTTLWQDLLTLRNEVTRLEKKGPNMHPRLDEFSYLDAFKLIEEENDEETVRAASGRLVELLKIEFEYDKRRVLRECDEKLADKNAEIVVMQRQVDDAMQLQQHCEAMIDEVRDEAERSAADGVAKAAEEAAMHVSAVEMDLNDKLDERDDEIAARDLQIKDLMLELESAENQIKDQEDRIEESARSRVELVAAELDALKQVLRDRENEMESLEKQTLKAIREKSEVGLEITSAKERNNELSNLLQATLEKELNLTQTTKEQDVRIGELTSENETMQRQLEDWSEEKANELVEMKGKLQARKGAMQAASETNQEMADFWEQEAKNLREELGLANEHSRKLRETNEGLQGKVDHEDAMMEKLSAERTSETAAYEHLKARIDSEASSLQQAKNRVRPMQKMISRINEQEIDNIRFFIDQLETTGSIEKDPIAVEFLESMQRSLFRVEKRSQLSQEMLLVEVDPHTGTHNMPRISEDRPLEAMIEFEYGKLNDKENEFLDNQELLVDNFSNDQMEGVFKKKHLKAGNVAAVYGEALDDDVDWEALNKQDSVELDGDAPGTVDTPENKPLNASQLKNLQRSGVLGAPGSGGLTSPSSAEITLEQVQKTAGPASVSGRSRRSAKSSKSTKSRNKATRSSGGLGTSANIASPSADVFGELAESRLLPVVEKEDDEVQTHLSWITDSQLGFVDVPNRRESFKAADSGAAASSGILEPDDFTQTKLKNMAASMQNDTAIGKGAIAWYRMIDMGMNTDANDDDDELFNSTVKGGTGNFGASLNGGSFRKDTAGSGDEASKVTSLGKAAKSLSGEGKAQLSTLLGRLGFNTGQGGSSRIGQVPDVFSPDSVSMALTYVQRGIARVCEAIANGDDPSTNAAKTIVQKWFGDGAAAGMGTTSLTPFQEAFADDAAVHWLYDGPESIGDRRGQLLAVLELRLYGVLEALAEQRDQLMLSKDPSLRQTPQEVASRSGARVNQRHHGYRTHLRGLIQEHRENMSVIVPSIMEEGNEDIGESSKLLLRGSPVEICATRPSSASTLPGGMSRPTSSGGGRATAPLLMEQRSTLKQTQKKRLPLLPTTVTDTADADDGAASSSNTPTRPQSAVSVSQFMPPPDMRAVASSPSKDNPRGSTPMVNPDVEWEVKRLAKQATSTISSGSLTILPRDKRPSSATTAPKSYVVFAAKSAIPGNKPMSGSNVSEEFQSHLPPKGVLKPSVGMTRQTSRSMGATENQRRRPSSSASTRKKSLPISTKPSTPPVGASHRRTSAPRTNTSVFETSIFDDSSPVSPSEVVTSSSSEVMPPYSRAPTPTPSFSLTGAKKAV